MAWKDNKVELDWGKGENTHRLSVIAAKHMTGQVFAEAEALIVVFFNYDFFPLHASDSFSFSCQYLSCLPSKWSLENEANRLILFFLSKVV